MPVLFNKETGLAEQLPDNDAASQALAAGSHELPLVGPDGKIGSASRENAINLISQGYKQPDKARQAQLLATAKHSTGVEQAKTFAEGAAEGATFGLSAGVERAALGNAEEQINRREANPGTHMAGQMTGLVGSSLTGVGEGALLAKAGAAVAAKVAPKLGASVLGRVGTAAVRSGIENAMFQSGDEAAKALVSDPNQTAETALAAVGMSALIGAGVGGGLGATSESWKMLRGQKVEGVLGAMHGAGGANEGAAGSAAGMAGADAAVGARSAFDAARDLPNTGKLFNPQTIIDSGLAIPEELKGPMGSGEGSEAYNAYQLSQKGSFEADKLSQRNLLNLKTQIADKSSELLGKSETDLAKLNNLDKAEIGNNFADNLSKKVDEVAAPINQAYKQAEERYGAVELANADKRAINDEVASYAIKEELGALPSDSHMSIVNKLAKKMEELKTLDSLRKYASDLKRSNPFGTEGYHTAKSVAGILDEARESMMDFAAGQGGELQNAAFKETKAAYGNMRQTIDSLQERLKLKEVYGPESFIKALKGARPEQLADRLNITKDTQLAELLKTEFPDVYAAAAQHELDKLAKKSISKQTGKIDIKMLTGHLNELPPQIKETMLGSEKLKQLEAIASVDRAIPKNMNPSNSGQTAYELFTRGALGHALDMLGPIGASVRKGSEMFKHFGAESEAAVRLANLKAMASGAPPNASGFKAAVEYTKAVIKGENLLTKSVEAVFTSGREVFAEPSEKDRAKLRKQVDAIALNPASLHSVGGDIGHYMPDHAAGLSTAAARNMQYLAQHRPNTAPMGPLDPERIASSTETAQYNRALDIALAPTMVLKSIKHGTLTVPDIAHLHAMFPALAGKMQSKLMDQLMSHKDRKLMPYKTKLSLSAFMGQPLDASMQPESIQASMQLGSVPGMTQPHPAAPSNTMSGAKGTALTKLSGLSSTTQQSRSNARATKW